MQLGEKIQREKAMEGGEDSKTKRKRNGVVGN